jgi:hypothetical protein
MKKIILLVATAFFATGCATMTVGSVRKEVAPYTTGPSGCSEADLKILFVSEAETGTMLPDEQKTDPSIAKDGWIARCKGKDYLCNNEPRTTNVTCTERAKKKK